MPTVRVTVRDAAGHSTFRDVEVVEQSAGLLGMCPVNSTSVNDIRAVFTRFPATKVVRFFSSGGFVPWDSPLLAAIPAGVHLVFSVKTRGLNWASHFSAMPVRWFGLVDGIWHHEPEQDPGGSDPLPADYRGEYQRIGASLAGHPLADKFRFGPCFTEFAARRDGETWYQTYGIVGTYPGVTRVGMDVYNTGYPQFTNYRSVQHFTEVPFGYSDRVGKPLSIDELGLERKNDPTGSICASVLPSVVGAFRQRCRTVTWFDRGDCYLGDSPTDPDGRNPEYAVMADLIEEAA